MHVSEAEEEAAGRLDVVVDIISADDDEGTGEAEITEIKEEDRVYDDP